MTKLMQLVVLLVYYKQVDLLRNNQWWEPIRLMHSIMALGRLYAAHVSTFPSSENVQKKTYNCAC